jgi:hypothetical protein
MMKRKRRGGREGCVLEETLRIYTEVLNLFIYLFIYLFVVDYRPTTLSQQLILHSIKL